jgi:hypothetical protein
MIVIRNRDHSLAFAARAGTGLRTGMVVKFSGTTANGTLQVAKATLADLEDATVSKGVVWFRDKDNTEVDFEADPTGVSLVAIAKDIPENAQVTVYTGKLAIAWHKSLLPTALVNAAPLTKVTVDPTTGFPAVAGPGDAEVDPDPVFGMIERKDGPEITLVVNF